MFENKEKTVSKVLEAARRKLLDTGTRNRLVHVNRANSRANCLNVINEHADEVFSILRVNGRKMRFKAMGKDKTAEGQEMLLALPEADLPSTSDRLTDSFLEVPLGPEALARRLQRMATVERMAEEEQGHNIFVRIYPTQTAANARRYLRDMERAIPMKITRVLTDNRKAFPDRLFGQRRRAATGQHEFDLFCTELGIERRLTPPMRPQTNCMVERFNGRIEDVLQSHRFHSAEDLELTLLRYVHLYNSQLQQSAQKGRTPINALKDWQYQKPELIRKRVYNHAGCDS